MSKQIRLTITIRTQTSHAAGEKAELLAQVDQLGSPVFRVKFNNGETSYLREGEFQMMVDVNCLAEFKRFLAQPGATVTVLEHSFLAHVRPEKKAEMLAPRTVKTLQATSVQFSNDSWLQFGKASDWSFEGDTATLHELEDDLKIVYKLSREE